VHLISHKSKSESAGEAVAATGILKVGQLAPLAPYTQPITAAGAISCPESSGFLVSWRSPGETLG